MLISAIFIGLPTLSGFRIGDMVLTLSSVSGVSTVWLAVLMALCGVAALFWLKSRLLAGLSGMVIALVAFPAANFGGYILGTLFGIVGASFTLAWRPLPEDQEDGEDQAAPEGRSDPEHPVPAPVATGEYPSDDHDTETLPLTTASDPGGEAGAVTREIPVDEAPADQAPADQIQTDAPIDDAPTTEVPTESGEEPK